MSYLLLPKLKAKMGLQQTRTNTEPQWNYQSYREQTPAEADITPSSRHEADSQRWVKPSIKHSRSKATRINYGGQNKIMREI